MTSVGVRKNKGCESNDVLVIEAVDRPEITGANETLDKEEGPTKTSSPTDLYGILALDNPKEMRTCAGG